ncbi:MAG: hypothetical protein VW268_08915 [Rhodospirillaceae bacterium]
MTAPLSKILESAPVPAALRPDFRLLSGSSGALFQVYGDGLPASRAYAVLNAGVTPAAVGETV